MFQKYFLFIWLFTVLDISFETCPDVPSQKSGTTLFLKELFIGKCLQYQISSPYAQCSSPEVDCFKLFDLFAAAFINKEECDTNGELYEKFFVAARTEVPKNKALLWSGTKILSDEVNLHGTRYMTLENTLAGYIANNLTWCGQLSSPGINYDSCLSSCPEKQISTSYDFWIRASINFAKQLEGEVTVLLNGSTDNSKGWYAFNENRVFGKYELPNLRPDKVTKIKVLLIHTLDRPKSETCSSPSMLKLKAMVAARKFPYECIEDPPSVKLLLCALTPDAAEC